MFINWVLFPLIFHLTLSAWAGPRICEVVLRNGTSAAPPLVRVQQFFTDRDISSTMARVNLLLVSDLPPVLRSLRLRAIKHQMMAGLGADRLELVKTFDVSELMNVVSQMRQSIEGERTAIVQRLTTTRLLREENLKRAQVVREAKAKVSAMILKVEEIEKSGKLSYFDLLDIIERGTKLRSSQPYSAVEAKLPMIVEFSAASNFPFEILIPSWESLTKKAISDNVVSNITDLGLLGPEFTTVDLIRYDRDGYLRHDLDHGSDNISQLYVDLGWSPKNYQDPIPLEVFNKWVAVLEFRSSIYRKARLYIERSTPKQKWYLEYMWFQVSHEGQESLAFNPDWFFNDFLDSYFTSFMVSLKTGVLGREVGPRLNESAMKSLWRAFFAAVYER